MSAPVGMATIFVGGFAATPALGQWARQVTEALAVLVAAAALMVASLCLYNHWPERRAKPRRPVAASAAPFAD